MPRSNTLRLSSLVAALCAAVAPQAVSTARAADKASCYPPCRTGYYCKEGQCQSLCNPPCPANQQCTPQGECEPLTRKRPTRSALENYFGVVGGYRPGLSDSALHSGEIRLEFGSKYMAAQVGPSFASRDGVKGTGLRTAFFGQIPLQLYKPWPLYLVPTAGLGYLYTWVDDAVSTHLQDIFIVGGLRARYDPIPRMALFLDVINVEVAFLRLSSNNTTDIHRDAVVPVSWGLTGGVVFLY